MKEHYQRGLGDAEDKTLSSVVERITQNVYDKRGDWYVER